jgi:hypothetical protein
MYQGGGGVGGGDLINGREEFLLSCEIQRKGRRGDGGELWTAALDLHDMRGDHPRDLWHHTFVRPGRRHSQPRPEAVCQRATRRSEGPPGQGSLG